MRSKLFALVIFSLFTSCISYERQVNKTNFTNQCYWKQAIIIKKHIASTLAATDMGPEWRESSNHYRLVLKSQDKEFTIKLTGRLGGRHKNSKNYDIRQTTNCQVYGVSADDGQNHYPLILNSSKPYICFHQSFQKNQALPNALELVGQALRHPEKHPDLHSVKDRQRESKAALTYALKHKNFAKMRLDAIQFIGNYKKASHDMLKQAQMLIAEFPELKSNVIQKAEQGEKSYLKIMAYLPEASYQDQFISWINQEQIKTKNNQSCTKIYNFTNALLIKTAILKSGNSQTVNTLVTLTRNHRCPLLKDAPNSYDHEYWSKRGQTVRIWAIKALAVIGSPEAKKVIDEWAQKDCYKYQRVKKKIEKRVESYFFFKINPKPDKISYNNFLVQTRSRHSLSCFAKIAKKIWTN